MASSASTRTYVNPTDIPTESLRQAGSKWDELKESQKKGKGMQAKLQQQHNSTKNPRSPSRSPPRYQYYGAHELPPPPPMRSLSDRFRVDQSNISFPWQKYVPLEQKIDGTWDPEHSSDLTVHLKLPVQENVEDILEELCRLQRLGHFTSAKQFFDNNLRDGYSRNPYVLIGYAEMLLEQGDYNTLSEINGDLIYDAGRNCKDKHSGDLFIWYWELIRCFVTYHKPSSASKAPLDPIIEGLGGLQVSIALSMDDISNVGQYIVSTEVCLFLIHNWYIAKYLVSSKC